MKKIIIRALLVLFMIVNVKAYSFNDTIIVSNGYINNNVKNEIYLIKDSRVPFIYNNKNIGYDNRLITGGLINNYEVNTSFIDNFSYLKSSLPYWEISGKKISDVSNSDDSNIKVTEYVKKGTKITGEGTYKNPWKFVEVYIVRLFSTDESMGKVTLGKAYAGYLDRASFEYTPLLGYKYSSNTCGMLNDGNTLTLLSVTDDIDCYVSFEKDMKKITFDNDGGSGCISASIQKGQAYGNLCTPSKDNYTFDGWYTNKAYETKIESTDIVNDDITLYAKWKINKIVYTNLSISCSNYSKGNYPYMFVYTGKCSIHNDGNDNWRIKFLTSGSLTSSISIKADVFVVGGGGGGANGLLHNGGGGGGGGYTKTYYNVQIPQSTQSVVIGSGGGAASAGGTSYFLSNSYSADGGRGGNQGNNDQANGNSAGGHGGSGGGAGGWVSSGNAGSAGGSNGSTVPRNVWVFGGNGQGTTTREFGTGDLYSGGGGGGSVRFYDIYYGGNGSLIWFPRANGGAGGGGYGGGSNGPATSGKENTGGGGGGGTGEHNGGYTAGASGGSGIVVIRNVR